MSMPISREAAEQAAARAEVWPPILAVDPGSAHSGVCLRVGTAALEAVTVTLPEGDPGAFTYATDYAAAVLAAAGALVKRHEGALLRMAHERGERAAVIRRAVECMVPPTPRARVKGSRVSVAPSVLASLPIACTVLGAVFARWPRVIRVPPRGGETGGWEALPGDPYPAALRGRTPEGWMKGGTDRSHGRSAWAIAGVAHALDLAQQRPLAEQVQQAVQAVLLTGPDPADAEALLRAVQAAIRTTGAGALVGREAAVAGAAARGLGAEPAALKAAVQAVLEEQARA